MVDNYMVRDRARCPECREDSDRCLCVVCKDCGRVLHQRDAEYIDDEWFCDECWERA